MSEKNHNHIEGLETKTPEHHHTHTPEHHNQEVNKAEAEAHQADKLEKAREAAQELAQEVTPEKDEILNELKVERTETEPEVASRPANSDLKKTTFNKEIRHIRHRLSKSDQLGSKIIHQKLIKNISEVSSKTITRPSGLLGGGIVAFLGTSTYLYLTKHIGLKYNYSMFLFLLIAGFILGILIEALVRLARGRKPV